MFNRTSSNEEKWNPTPEEAIDAIQKNWPDEKYSMLREALELAIVALKEKVTNLKLSNPKMSSDDAERIDKNYNAYEMNEEQILFYQNLKDWFPETAKAIMSFCPDSRERSLALTKLEECMFWANKAIERN